MLSAVIMTADGQRQPGQRAYCGGCCHMYSEAGERYGEAMWLTNANSIMLCWLIGMVVFLVIEIVTLGLTTIWFAGGALIAFLASLLGASVPVQVILFFAVSFILLLFTRPVLQKKLNSTREKTNVNSMVGKEGKVEETIDNFNETGKILISGMEWTARSEQEDVVIPKGSKVIVKAVKGVKVIVANA